jgi:hypothetical protein
VLPVILVAALMGGGGGAAHAQDRLVGAGRLVTGVMAEGMRFNGLLRLDQVTAGDSMVVRELGQVLLPVTAVMPVGSQWTLDLATHYTATAVTVEDGAASRRLHLAGPGDVRLRVVGRLRDDAVLVTAGVNLPAGMARLTPEGVDALRVGAAPMLGLGSPPATSGAGGTLGVVLARTIKGWAVAAGTSYEQRGQFQPVAARLLGTTPESFTPGGAIRGTLGADRLLGAHRLMVNVAANLFLDDILAAPVSGTSARVRPGEVLSLDAELQLAVPGLRETAVWGSLRRRGTFARDGNPLEGSQGYYVDGGWRGSVPVQAGLDVVTALDLRWQSGMLVNPGVLTMGGTAATGTLGLSWRHRGRALEPFVRAQGGNLRQRLGRSGLPLADSDFFGMSVGVLLSTPF